MRNFILWSLLISTLACSEKRPRSQTEITVSTGAITASYVFPGGVIVRMVSSIGTVLEETLTTSPYVIEVPFGTWDVHLVGYEGADTETGPYRCGSLNEVNFSEDKKELDLTVSSANCVAEPYLSLTANKWNKAAWNGVKWGP
jgi:hypothetical protein